MNCEAELVQAECSKCQRIPGDLLRVLLELDQLKAGHFRGSIEYHLDGSGRIKSRKKSEFSEI